jgi:hypothetical protein
MGVYRSAQGKTIDMARLAAMNERVRAVGNMNVNARGDTIDSNGRVVVPVTKKVGEAYQKTVANRAANLLKKKREAAEIAAANKAQSTNQQKVKNEVIAEPVEEEIELLEEEFELENDEDALAIEVLKAEENKKNFVVKPASEAPDFFDPNIDVTTKKK